MITIQLSGTCLILSWVPLERSLLHVRFPLFVHIYSFTDRSRMKSELSCLLRTRMRIHFRRTNSDNSHPSYTAYKWPIRSVERLPPYKPTKLKIPVLIVGNTASETHSRTMFFLSLTTMIPRLTQSRRSRVRKMSLTFSVTMPSYSNNLASVTQASLKPHLVAWLSRTITSSTPQSVFFQCTPAARSC